MEQLSLNKFGVQQLNAKEIVEIEGGNPLLWLLAGVIVSELLDRNAPADFWEGWNDAKQNKK
ncbi:hypothetical protein [Tenuifilum sp.]|uniref:hypothetical protein n=1 Tax=Tenuifilum sp. TaxID=2760880 RepID=UPI001B55ADB9|nr:hypothetical protein [Bacteroidales bacterium]HOK60070.1 hypothetical protein [Tenuifilum sp.]HOK84708.1 hypothetical protein [Tenuifilum sp.]HOU73777.1 hypothetical protein [Tenuifilum sp.]HPP88959.1 hypothetical protein [Tenuifilum sp.]